MSRKVRPEDAVSILRAVPPGERSTKEQEALGEQAADILRKKGDILLLKGGVWSKSDSRRSTDRGTLFAQATRPVAIAGSGLHVALRDRLTYPQTNIELVCVEVDPKAKDGGIKAVAQASKDDVLAAPNDSLVIPGSIHLREGELEAVGSLLDALDEELDPFNEQIPGLPQVVLGDILTTDKDPIVAIDLRANPEEIGSLITARFAV